jgi:GTPase SAR1 family protein
MYFTPYNEVPVVRATVPKDASPEALAKAIEENPDAYVERGGILVSRDWEKSTEDGLDLPTGIYRFKMGGWMPPRLVPCSLRDDTYIPLSKMYEPTAAEVRDFVQADGIYADAKRRKILQRLGILLVGPPGNGKTTMIRELIYREIPDDGVAIFMKYCPPVDFIEALDGSTRGRIKVVVFEELAAMVYSDGVEEILDFLDGESSMDKTVTIATTNYPWCLPKTLLDRSGRFDLMVEILNPDEEQRREFLTHFGKASPPETVIHDTFGMSVADLREIILYSERRKLSLSQAVESLRARKAAAERLRHPVSDDSWSKNMATTLLSSKSVRRPTRESSDSD